MNMRSLRKFCSSKKKPDSLRPTFFFHCLLLASVGLTGCGALSVASMGNKILQGVGLLSGKKVFDAGEGLLKATDEMTREEEYYLGRAVAANVLSKFSLTDNEELNRYVQKIGLVVGAHSAVPETFGGYHFGVIDSSVPQAMSAPGGFVFISTGLLELLPDEDALAAVLAHEVAHVSLHHGVKTISQENLNKTVLALGQLAGTLNCAQVLQQATGVFGVAVDDIVGTLLERGYSRTQESEADLHALQYLLDAGYSPSALEVALSALSSDHNSRWYATHPGSEERIASVLSWIESHPSSVTEQAKMARMSRFQGVIQ